MKVERAGSKGVAGSYKVGSSLTRESVPAPVAANPADKLTLSREAQQVARLRSQLRAAPEVRMDVVERIKAQVEAGTYSAEPRAVAEKMLKSGVLD